MRLNSNIVIYKALSTILVNLLRRLCTQILLHNCLHHQWIILRKATRFKNLQSFLHLGRYLNNLTINIQYRLFHLNRLQLKGLITQITDIPRLNIYNFPSSRSRICIIFLLIFTPDAIIHHLRIFIVI